MLLKKLVGISLKSNSWVKSQGVLARLLRAYCCKNKGRRRDFININPLSSDLEAARTAQFMASMDETCVAMKKGKLSNLSLSIKNGIVMMSGRFKEKDLAKLLGKSCLPLVMAQTRLAMLLCPIQLDKGIF